ncbi:hypothetical protein LguiA_009547 [Lonicera macranthoides]
MVSCYWQKVKLNKEGKMRGAHGSTQNGRRLLEMLMGYPPTPHALFFTRSFILRPTPQPPSSSYAPPPPLRLSTTTTSISMSTVDQSSEGLDHLFKQKRILRSRVKRDLKSMDPTLRSQEDNAIQSVILEAPWFKSCKRLCAYISCSALREVDTSKILLDILQNPAKEVGKKLYVPRVEDRNSYMRMLNISSTEDLIANSMNILEPAPSDAYGNEREDRLAFDKSGRRLGRGGG